LSKHEHYRKLCALAALGEIPSAEAQDLDQHLKQCPECRLIHAEYLGLNASLLPAPGEDDLAQIDALKAATWASTREALKHSQPLVVRTYPDAEPLRDRADKGSFGYQWQFAVAAVAVLCAFWVGARYERKVLETNMTQRRVSDTPPSVPSVLPAAVPRPSDIAGDLEIKKALATERSTNERLQQLVNAKDNQVVSAVQEAAALRQQLSSQDEMLKSTQSLLIAKTAELKQLEEHRDGDSATLVALKYQVQDLTEKLATQSESLKRERDLLAGGREIRDIISARNLHIVDVYDTDPTGHTKRAFARAFYTEGKSLVFYAYDLPRREDDAKYSYVAWGQKNGSKSAIKNLGILINDDKGQKRWTLSFSDPNVLAEVDSVFITLEPAGQDVTKPSGKRMLTAYLNDQVNHP